MAPSQRLIWNSVSFLLPFYCIFSIDSKANTMSTAQIVTGQKEDFIVPDTDVREIFEMIEFRCNEIEEKMESEGKLMD